MCPHATSLVPAVGVASTVIEHMVAVARPILGKESASINNPAESGRSRTGVQKFGMPRFERIPRRLKLSQSSTAITEC